MSDELSRLQGVWFLASLSVEGRLAATHAHVFPAQLESSLTTIIGELFHVTSNADYYFAGGRLVLFTNPKRMQFVQPELPDEFQSGLAQYEVAEDELVLHRQVSKPSTRFDIEFTARYVRVANEPTLLMLALFESAIRHWPQVWG